MSTCPPASGRSKVAGACCQAEWEGKFIAKMDGSPAWIRTTIHGSKGRCPTVRRPGKKEGKTSSFSLTHACYNTPGELVSRGSQSRPVPGPDFKPGVRYFVSLVGSTPTGFRHV